MAPVHAEAHDRPRLARDAWRTLPRALRGRGFLETGGADPAMLADVEHDPVRPDELHLEEARRLGRPLGLLHGANLLEPVVSLVGVGDVHAERSEEHTS